MEELLDRLRNARLARDISLEEISKETKIQLRFLQALESGDFSVFAGEVYLKGAIRNYCKIVGLDPEDTVALFNQLQKEEISTQEETTPGKTPGERVIKTESSNLNGIIVLILLVFFILAGVWIVFSGNGEVIPGDDAETDEPVENNDGEKDVVVDDNNNNDNNNTVPADPNAARDEDDAGITLAETSASDSIWEIRGADEIKLSIHLTGRCWIDVQGDGISFQSRTFSANEKIDVTSREQVWVRLGNTGGVRLYINGIHIKEIREKPDPHNCIFTLVD